VRRPPPGIRGLVDRPLRILLVAPGLPYLDQPRREQPLDDPVETRALPDVDDLVLPLPQVTGQVSTPPGVVVPVAEPAVELPDGMSDVPDESDAPD
jgi:hypothetical protein